MIFLSWATLQRKLRLLFKLPTGTGLRRPSASLWDRDIPTGVAASRR